MGYHWDSKSRGLQIRWDLIEAGYRLVRHKEDWVDYGGCESGPSVEWIPAWDEYISEGNAWYVSDEGIAFDNLAWQRGYEESLKL